MIEAEYKARLSDPEAVRERLRSFGAAEEVRYQDAYFDTADRALNEADCELRLRTITAVGGEQQHLLTFKDAAVEESTRSKPEYETHVSDRKAMADIVARLGYGPFIAFTKQCENFRFNWAGRDIVATVVTVPEIDGTFLELETQVEEDGISDALRDLRSVLAELGVSLDELTTEVYTNAVAESRGL
ncbi:class IV adenylate cyclase [Nocardia pseudovaccinii]|uniref:class IV adenylate cyclase n=1 Tax=Nocardia pseudovaccinii TaxID=189540 RepID=UPI0007A38436|nr:class IV adenylate cyclase [Nocardia pseudovaccinii]